MPKYKIGDRVLVKDSNLPGIIEGTVSEVSPGSLQIESGWYYEMDVWPIGAKEDLTALLRIADSLRLYSIEHTRLTQVARKKWDMAA